jgi:hypothetical protein
MTTPKTFRDALLIALEMAVAEADPGLRDVLTRMFDAARSDFRNGVDHFGFARDGEAASAFVSKLLTTVDRVAHRACEPIDWTQTEPLNENDLRVWALLAAEPEGRA